MRTGVSSVSSGATTHAHSLNVNPKGMLVLSATTRSAATTVNFASMGAGIVGMTTGGISQQGMGFNSFRTGTVGAAVSTLANAAMQAGSSAGAFDGRSIGNLGSSGTVEFLTSAAGWPAAVALVGGSDAKVNTPSTASVPAVAGSTVGTTNVPFPLDDFTPNAGFFLGRGTHAASTHSCVSFGFACQTSDGTIKQWSITQSGRDLSSAVANRAASTAYCMITNDSASIQGQVRVSSVKTSGFELTVDAASTAISRELACLRMRVPKVDAGVATITTNGVGAGQTGFTVTGQGPNVSLVVMASIGSSVDAQQAHNFWSIGFSDSANNQRCISGRAINATTVQTDYGSYFSNNRAFTLLTSPTAVWTQGTYAQTTDGFTMTMDSTVANGFRVHWAALSNVVTDLEAHIFSSGQISALVNEVARLQAAIQSSATVNSSLREVGRMSANILSSATVIGVSLDKEFETTESKLHATAEIRTRVQGYSSSEESTVFSDIVNTSSPDRTFNLDVTTQRYRLGLASLQNAKHVSVIPPSTNTHPMRLAAGQSSPGVPVSSVGGLSMFVSEQAGTDLFLYTTVAGSTVEGVRITIR